jgi:hypothetical protein
MKRCLIFRLFYTLSALFVTELDVECFGIQVDAHGLVWLGYVYYHSAVIDDTVNVNKLITYV